MSPEPGANIVAPGLTRGRAFLRALREDRGCAGRKRDSRIKSGVTKKARKSGLSKEEQVEHGRCYRFAWRSAGRPPRNKEQKANFLLAMLEFGCEPRPAPTRGGRCWRGTENDPQIAIVSPYDV